MSVEVPTPAAPDPDPAPAVDDDRLLLLRCSSVEVLLVKVILSTPAVERNAGIRTGNLFLCPDLQRVNNGEDRIIHTGDEWAFIPN